MAVRTLIARVADGLILCESDDGHRLTPEVKQQASQLAAKLHSFPQRATVEAGDYTYHLAIGGGVCCLGLFDRGYPRTVAFALLDEMFELFHEELKLKFGTGSVDYGSQVDCIERPYYFGTFGRQLTRASAEYKDPTRGKALKMLHADISNLFILQTTVKEVFADGAGAVQGAARKRSGAGSGKALLYSPFKWLWGHLLLVVIGMTILLLACDALVHDGLPILHDDAHLPVACFIFGMIMLYVVRTARGGTGKSLVPPEMLDMFTDWSLPEHGA